MKKKYQKSKDIWDVFRDFILDNDLIYIAQSDYGYEEEKNYKILKEILNKKQLPLKLDWIPREVLSLVGWDEYRGNIKSTQRVFFCSTLLLMASKNKESVDYLEGQVEKIITSIDSANILGKEVLEKLFDIFEDILSTITIKDFEEDYLYFYLGLYLLAILTKKSDIVVESIINKVFEIEKLMYDFPQENILKYTCFNQKIMIWKEYLVKYTKFN